MGFKTLVVLALPLIWQPAKCTVSLPRNQAMSAAVSMTASEMPALAGKHVVLFASDDGRSIGPSFVAVHI